MWGLNSQPWDQESHAPPPEPPLFLKYFIWNNYGLRRSCKNSSFWFSLTLRTGIWTLENLASSPILHGLAWFRSPSLISLVRDSEGLSGFFCKCIFCDSCVQTPRVRHRASWLSSVYDTVASTWGNWRVTFAHLLIFFFFICKNSTNLPASPLSSQIWVVKGISIALEFGIYTALKGRRYQYDICSFFFLRTYVLNLVFFTSRIPLWCHYRIFFIKCVI